MKEKEKEEKKRRRYVFFLLLFFGAAFGLAYYLAQRPRPVEQAVERQPASPVEYARPSPVPAPPKKARAAAVQAPARHAAAPAEPLPEPAAGAVEIAEPIQPAAQVPEAARAEPAVEPLPEPAAVAVEPAAPLRPAGRTPVAAARLYGRIGGGAAISAGRGGSLMPAAALFYPWRRSLDIVAQVQQEDWRVPGGAHARSGGWAALGGLRFASGGGKGGPYGLLTGGYRSAPDSGGAVKGSACAAVELGWRLEFSGGTALNAGLSGAGGGTSYVSAGLALELPLMSVR